MRRMKMAKKKWILLIGMFCLLLFTTSGGAIAAGMTDELLPKQEENQGSVELESGKYPLVNYGMDTKQDMDKMSDFLPWNWDDKMSKSISSLLSTVNSGLWKINTVLSSLTISIVHEAYTADIVGQFGEETGKLIKGITGISNYGFSGSSIWSTFLYAIIVFSVAWLGFRAAIQRQGSVAISGLLSIMAILGIAIGFFTYADKILKSMNDVTSEAQNMMLSYSVGTVNNEEFEKSDGLNTMKNQLFDTMIKNPWLLMQFGTTDEKAIEKEWDKEGSRIDTLLKTNTMTEERSKAIEYEVNELDNENMKPEALLDRLVVNLFIFAVNAVLGVFVTMLTGSIVIYSFLALVYTMYTVLTLLISVIPKFQSTGLNSLGKLAHAFYMKLGLTFLATLAFTFNNWLYSWIEPSAGMLIVFAYQIAIMALIFIKRKDLLNIINKPFESLGVRNDRGLNVESYKKAYQNTKTNAVKLARPFIQKAPIKNGATAIQKIKSNPGVGLVGHRPINKEVNTGAQGSFKKPVTNAAATAQKQGQNVTNVAGNAEKTAANVTNVNRDINNVQGSESTSQNGNIKPQSSPVQMVDLKVSERPKGTEYGPGLQDENNLRSLEKTMDKGGFAHKVKDGGEIKTGEREIKINDWKEYKNVSEQK